MSDGARSETDGLGNEVTVVEPAPGSRGWTTYFIERGAVIDQRFFDTETSACEHVMAQLDHDLQSAATTSVRLSPGAWERAHAISAEEDRRYQEVVRARGLDPRTGLPRPHP